MAARAERVLARLGYRNVHVRCGNGRLGWPEQAPFDGIIVTAAADGVPAALLAQLAPGGVMVIPVARAAFSQDLLTIRKHEDGSIEEKVVLPVMFVPLTGRETAAYRNRIAPQRTQHGPGSMKWSFSIGRIAGIDVRVHLTFLLLLAWFAIWNWQASGDTGQVMSAMIFILALFACVVMHEFGHALVARRFGVATRSITLLPIGGVASMERMPENPLHEIAVAIAGPMVNFAIALVIYLLMPADSIVAMPQAGPDVDGSAELPGGTSLAGQLLFINLVLGVFNLLPAFPMDGGRVLRALLSLFMPSLRATRLAASIGQGLALALGLLGLLGNPFLILIAVFVWIGAAGEAGYAEMKSAISSVPVTRAMLTEYETVHEYDSLGHVADLTLKGSQKDFPVVRGDEVIGVVTQRTCCAACARRARSASWPATCRAASDAQPPTRASRRSSNA
ncbi:MAG: site-2 protease family protein [Gammaproteobacteria bacterium]|nr:site-2 protease family protein [Gammaproteobacteria bacterium]